MKRYNVFVLIENYSKQVEDIVAEGYEEALESIREMGYDPSNYKLIEVELIKEEVKQMEFFRDLPLEVNYLVLGLYYLVKVAAKKGVKEALKEVNKNGKV